MIFHDAKIWNEFHFINNGNNVVFDNVCNCRIAPKEIKNQGHSPMQIWFFWPRRYSEHSKDCNSEIFTFSTSDKSTSDIFYELCFTFMFSAPLTILIKHQIHCLWSVPRRIYKSIRNFVQFYLKKENYQC